jgi:hypothetical protein
LGIVVLFISVSFQPIIAEKTLSVKKESDYYNVDFDEAKEYLFQTLIDISNNPEVKQFLNEHKHALITINNNNYDCKNAIQKIRSQNPKLLKLILFTKPKMTYEYLETNYNKGLETVDNLGKEESLEMVDSISISNPELFIELKNIIVNNKEVSNRILVLGEMNNNVQYNLDFGGNQGVICITLFFCFLPLVFSASSFGNLYSWAEEHHRLLLAVISYPIYSLFYLLAASIAYLMELLDCDINVTPP